MFSKACQYGIKAMIYLAANTRNGELLNLEKIAFNIGSPIAFTAKVLQKLVKKNLVTSLKGTSGGFKIEGNNLAKISLLQVVSAIDGDDLLVGCGLGLNTCNSKQPCPIHNQYSTIRSDLKSMLADTHLSDFNGKMKRHDYVLTR